MHAVVFKQYRKVVGAQAVGFGVYNYKVAGYGIGQGSSYRCRRAGKCCQQRTANQEQFHSFKLSVKKAEFRKAGRQFWRKQAKSFLNKVAKKNFDMLQNGPLPRNSITLSGNLAKNIKKSFSEEVCVNALKNAMLLASESQAPGK